MKILKTLFILVFLTFLSCKKEDKSFETPEKVAAHTLEVLKNIDKKTNEEFLQEVMTYQELKDLANNPNAKLGEIVKSKFESVSQEAFTDTSIRDFNDIKETGKTYNIDWSSITFSEFKHLVIEFGNMKGLRVETYFKNKDGQIYFVKSQSFYDGKGYRIVKLAEIVPKR
ncbi:hypothetical protein Flavo103_12810 [Flavobacterium collinsii]|jgi:hypothetical protein|uniref:hypothetical protein n=1 Tax=Flavobacterium collinsii TaxID=1114861 RepID=UPI0022CA7AD4|nr:hypothetical protein [Flavobacterium collinsii]GIQ58145.1 hypothetical protein Flavo103_12810 [Flavobacterium collinsii]